MTVARNLNMDSQKDKILTRHFLISKGKRQDIIDFWGF